MEVTHHQAYFPKSKEGKEGLIKHRVLCGKHLCCFLQIMTPLPGELAQQRMLGRCLDSLPSSLLILPQKPRAEGKDFSVLDTSENLHLSLFLASEVAVICIYRFVLSTTTRISWPLIFCPLGYQVSTGNLLSHPSPKSFPPTFRLLLPCTNCFQ